MKCREDPQGEHCNSILDLSGGKHGEYLLYGKGSRALLKLTVLEPLLNIKIFKVLFSKTKILIFIEQFTKFFPCCNVNSTLW